MTPQDIFGIDYSLKLAEAVERATPLSNFLADTFFPKKETVMADVVAVEYKRKGLQIAPYIVKNAGGLNMSREKSKISWYKTPRFGARRVIGLEDLEQRQFGELPDIYRATRPEERFAKMQAQDLADLIKMHNNRRAIMASEILNSGKLVMNAYADDGRIIRTDTIEFEGFNEVTPTILWSNAAAKIYEDLYDISEKIQESAGQIPTIAICGKNVERRLLANTEIKNWLMIPNRENLAMANFAPRFTDVNARYIGRISALNLDLYSFADTYIENGTKKYLVGEDNVIMGVPGNGKEIHSPVSFFKNGNWNTVSAGYVPVYSYDDNAQTTSLTVYSRFLLVPETLDDWYLIKTEG